MELVLPNYEQPALIDAEDFEKIKDYHWYYNKAKTQNTGYVIAAYWSEEKKKQVIVKLHRVILDVTDPKIFIDHKNHNGLDCRKRNLRIGNNQVNQFNRKKKRTSKSAYKGVGYDRGIWVAVIQKDGVPTRLGSFDSEKEAAHYYDRAANELFGEWAKLNFPNDPESRKPMAVKKRKSSSRFKNVYYCNTNKRWFVRKKDPSTNKVKTIGRFVTELEAAKAVNYELK